MSGLGLLTRPPWHFVMTERDVLRTYPSKGQDGREECRVWVRLLGSHPGTAAHQLCGLGPITQPNLMGG